jgi:catechol 2,3-dioxygenase-like lactoylglutathione lyase family enzyme
MPIAASPSRRAAVNLTESDAFPAIHGVHHQAFRCRDAEETRHFYEDVLRLPLALVVYHDNVPSTREYKPYYQLFFEMADGSYLAFVDLLDGRACAPDPGTPPWLNHVALEVGSRSALDAAKHALGEEGIDVVGPIDHAFIESIYCFDPNGIRLELTYRTATPEALVARARQAPQKLAERRELLAVRRELAGGRA